MAVSQSGCGRALSQLGIQMIAAYSPEARGRSERAFGAHHRGLMTAGEKRAAEILEAAVGHPVVVEHNVAGQIVILRAEAVV